MDKTRKEIIITGVLILVLFISWANSFKFLRKRAAAKHVPAVSASGQTGIPSSGHKVQPALQENTVNDPGWGRCPFSGKVYSSTDNSNVTVQDYRIQGIMWDERKPVAIINGQLAVIGSRVGVCRVKDIKKDRAILNDGSRDIELKVE